MVVASLFLLLASQQAAAEPVERHNVVLVIGDDIAAADVENAETPTLDYLAEHGANFTRAYANPTCSPTRRTIMFGRWWGRDSGSVCKPPGIYTPSPELLSLPKLMKLGGYETALFGKWHIGSNLLGPWEQAPQVHGFDTWRAGLAMNVKFCGSRSYTNWMRVDDGEVQQTDTYHTIAVRDAFNEWWTSTSGPKFAVVAYQAAHVPYHVPPESLLPEGYPTPSSTSSRRDKFKAVIVSLDHALGEMLEVVDLDNTWFVFVGDNGTPVRVAPEPERAKGTTYERGIHVPLIVAHADLDPVESPALVHTVDLMATVADLVGIPVPEELDSRSFARCLEEPAYEPREWVYCQVSQDRCVRSKRYKLRVDGDVEELFDLEADPHERTPLDTTDPELRAVRDKYYRVLEKLGQ